MRSIIINCFLGKFLVPVIVFANVLNSSLANNDMTVVRRTNADLQDGIQVRCRFECKHSPGAVGKRRTAKCKDLINPKIVIFKEIFPGKCCDFETEKRISQRNNSIKACVEGNSFRSPGS